MSMHVAQIEHLSKNNYDTWKMQMQAVLVRNERWLYVNGMKTRPQAEQDIPTWELADQKAKADIILNISPSELCHVKHCQTSRDVWVKLEEIYQSKGPARKATLLKQLIFSKMSQEEGMDEHLNKFFGIIDKLNEMNVEIADDLVTILLLYSVPDSYENFRCAIEARDVLPTPEILKIKLLEEFQARRGKESTQNQQNAFQANKNKFGSKQEGKFDKNYKKTSNKENKPYIKCTYCHKKGHKATQCWNKKNEEAACAEDAFYAVNEDAHKHVSHQDAIVANTFSANLESTDVWCLDSGATSHMCKNRSKFVDLKEVTNQKVRLANNELTEVKGIGTVYLSLTKGKRIHRVKLENTLYIPKLSTNLFSASKATTNGRKILLTENTAVILNQKGDKLVIAQRKNGLYIIEPVSDFAGNAVTDIKQAELWHRRYGHLNMFDLKKLFSQNLVLGTPTFLQQDFSCKVCVENKQTTNPFPKHSNTKCQELLELVSSDVCGPMRTTSLGGARYFVTFIDHKSRWVTVYFLKSKDEVKEAFMKYKSFVENQKDRKIKILRTDNGLEYCGKSFNRELEKAGIKREYTTPHTPQQNGIAERMNRTLVEMARCLISQANLPKVFWAEAIATAAYIRNRCPTKSLENVTPYESWFERKPNVSHFKTFGCKAYVLDKTATRGKFDQKSKEHIFLGYATDAKAYRLWDPESRKIIKSRDVKVIEEQTDHTLINEDNSIQKFHLQVPATGEGTESKEKQKDEEEELTEDDVDEENVEDRQEQSENEVDTHEENYTSPKDYATPKRAPGRPKLLKTGKRGRPRKLYQTDITQTDTTEQNAQMAFSAIGDVDVEEALTGPHKLEWKRAMSKEYEALVRHNTWTLVELPKNCQAIGCRWVLRTKYLQDGTVERRKARLVAKGCAQRPGLDFAETYSPVARLSSLRILTALSAELGLTLYQLDIEMAYIHGELEETVYMRQPDGFISPGEEDLVCRLNKSIYGLKQSGRQWYKKLNSRLEGHGMTPLNGDKCFYIKRSNSDILYVLVYVDDLVVATNNINSYRELVQCLNQEFRTKELGLLHYCLGIEFIQDQTTKSTFMSQKQYAQDLLFKFGMSESKTKATPLEPKLDLSKDNNDLDNIEVNRHEYQSLIGSLMYLAVATRPDLTYTVSYLSQFNQNPNKQHWLAAKHALRYLKGTTGQGLKFQKSGKSFFGFADSDWASDSLDRRSHSGFFFVMANAAITWESRKQRTTALSSTEAEYMSLTEATKEAIYLRGILRELCVTNLRANRTVIYCDNQGAQALMKNPIHHTRTKHIDIKYHFVREKYECGEIDVKYTPSESMYADILTKSPVKLIHNKCMQGMGMTQT